MEPPALPGAIDAEGAAHRTTWEVRDGVLTFPLPIQGTMHSRTGAIDALGASKQEREDVGDGGRGTRRTSHGSQQGREDIEVLNKGRVMMVGKGKQPQASTSPGWGAGEP
jgi:hypothetical protein